MNYECSHTLFRIVPKQFTVKAYPALFGEWEEGQTFEEHFNSSLQLLLTYTFKTLKNLLPNCEGLHSLRLLIAILNSSFTYLNNNIAVMLFR